MTEDDAVRKDREVTRGDHASGRRIGLEHFLDEAQDDLVRHQQPLIHEPLGLGAERRAVRGLLLDFQPQGDDREQSFALELDRVLFGREDPRAPRPVRERGGSFPRS